jgi:hypothetical protein
MRQVLSFMFRMIIVAGTCYLISQGNLTAAAIIIGVYWVLLEALQLQVVYLSIGVGLSMAEAVRNRVRGFN